MLVLHWMLASAIVVAQPAQARPEPLGNVRVTVTFRWKAVEERDGIAVRPRRGSVGVSGDSRRSRSSSTTRQQLLVMSGGHASIRIAEEIPYSEWFFTWGRNRRLWAQGVQWRDVATGMDVSPVILSGGRLRVTLTPYFEYFLDARRERTQVHELATEVIVREGEELDLGGVPWSDSEFRERFFIGYARGRGTSEASITLRADVE